MATFNPRGQLEQEMVKAFGLVPQWTKSIPDSAIVGFWRTMSDFQLAETKIPNKYKELIGLAVSGATRCRYCQLFHIEAARLNGATEEEINEACMVGAHTMSTSTFLNAEGIDFDEFRRETLRIVGYVKSQQQLAPTVKPGVDVRPGPRV